MSKSTDTMLAFLVGAVAGGITALLLAPDKGSETRRKLREGASNMYGKGEEMFEEKTAAAQARAQALVDSAKAKLHEAENAARSQVSAIKEAVREGRDAYSRELNKS